MTTGGGKERLGFWRGPVSVSPSFAEPSETGRMGRSVLGGLAPGRRAQTQEREPSDDRRPPGEPWLVPRAAHDA